MDSLAQELLEIIIDYVPPYQARSCSLVARRWRKRSQQLHFGSVVFTGEREVGRWFRNIIQDPDGILSYVQEVEFRCILHWLDATLLGRTLKCFRHARTLKFYETGLPPSEVQKIVISGDFGKEITSLDFVSTFSTMPTLVQLIFSLPKLTDVVICSPKCDEPAIPAVPNVTWQREPLLSLDLLHPRGGATEFLALCGITSYRVGVSVGDPMMEKIVACSSEIMSELQLKGMRLHENFVPETDADGSHRCTLFHDTCERIFLRRPSATSSSPHNRRSKASFKQPFHPPLNTPFSYSPRSGPVLRYSHSYVQREYPRFSLMDRRGQMADMGGYGCQVKKNVNSGFSVVARGESEVGGVFA